MASVTLRNVGKSYGNVHISKDINLDIEEGEFVVFVGPSGCGKSTLLRMIAGLEDITTGELYIGDKLMNDVPPAKRGIGMVFQSYALYPHLNVAENMSFGLKLAGVNKADRDQRVNQVAEILQLAHLLERKPKALSGGQRTKVLLAKLLLEKPDILLLDEPTNYLDAEHIDWLKRYLQNYENAFVLISHDIPFLNDVINIVYHVENQQLTRYSGDYYQFQEVYAMKKSQLEAAYERQQKEIADLKDFVARNKARVATRNMAMSRQKKLDKMDIIELQSEKPKPSFDFKPARTPGRFIFQAKDLQIGYDRPLTKPLNLTFERNQKVAIIGANGIGKTTLLKSLLGIIPPIAGEVERGDYLELGYFEQEVEGGNRQTPLEAVWNAFPALNQAEVRAALARCGLTTKHIESQIQVLSGGEQAKARFCLLMNRENNVLVLDEPTNHLDVDAKEELKRALKEYKGSILMVCHEPDFYEGWMDQIWDFNQLT